jgi:molybdopterin molybdotransferase
MISVEEALEKILSQVQVLETEEKPILDCLGQVLAENVYSDIDVPPLANASMDGYAVMAENTRTASAVNPRVLSVVGELAAGALPLHPIKKGEALRIMTGAPIPQGADAVVKFEDTDEPEHRTGRLKPSRVAIMAEVKPGTNIRPAGEDISKGSLALSQGTLLQPAAIGVLASIGRVTVKVIRRPIVAIIATGDELVEPGQKLPPGHIYNSNAYGLAALVRRYGGIPKLLGIARDTRKDVESKVRQGLDADLVLTSGGVSHGDYDVVKDILASLGEITFWTVCMKPGKPLAFGKLRANGREIPHLGLPGYPVSSMVVFEVLARPALLKMMGRRQLDKPSLWAIAEHDIVNKDGRRLFARAIVIRRQEQFFVKLAGPQLSGVLSSLAQANALAIVPENISKVKAGEKVEVMILDWD